ncbi:MAG: sigma-70 family RNA polymerase sigma factor [Saprospiraceae bacterium]|nr:sigma-70 family RNA polymerase sigma factor [Lewinellaceae bacterium]
MPKPLTYETEAAYLMALRREEPEAFETLYRQYFRMVAKQALLMGVTGTDIEDLFQELVLILVRKVRDTEFKLSAKLSTYVYAVARNLLLKKTGKKAEFPVEESTLLALEQSWTDDALDTRIEMEEQLNVVVGYLELLEDDCREVLRLSFYEKLPQTEIAQIMGYADSFVKVKKHRCLEYLRKQVKSHPLFKDLQNDAS